ncbi:MAG: bifunctional precorrin-2 dehydrogenase/sirohydrochlorin ferrochelatase [Candidatus Methylomirabilales bacterium]
MPTGEPRLYPMMVRLAGRRCLVVGGGAVAERKIEALLQCGARVEVISPAATAGIQALAEAGRVTWRRRPVEPGDLPGAFLAFAATDDPAVNREVARRAAEAGGQVNVADDPEASTFHVPATLRRGDLCVAVATGGGSPALARRLRRRLEATLGPEYEAFLAALRVLRERARRRIPSAEVRQAVYRRALDSDLYDCAARGDAAAVEACIAALLAAARDARD